MHVHLVNSLNRHQYLDEIEQMHRHRHRVFVESLGWRALESPDKLDIDEFDNSNAHYLIAVDHHGVRGSARLMPSWRPNMLNTLFPEFARGNPPIGPGIWEWTRHAPGAAEFSREVNNEVRHLISIAALEFAASRGIDTYTGIVDTRFVGRVTEMGWWVEPLGEPINYGEGMAFGFRMSVETDHLTRLRESLGRRAPALLEMPQGIDVATSRLARRSMEIAASDSTLSLEKAEEALRVIEGALEPGA